MIGKPWILSQTGEMFEIACIKYLGHTVSKEGIQPVPSKIEAISKCPRAYQCTSIEVVLGLTNYYGRFIPNLSTMLHPLNNLLQAKQAWKWSSDCVKAFLEVKSQIISAYILTH